MERRSQSDRLTDRWPDPLMGFTEVRAMRRHRLNSSSQHPGEGKRWPRKLHLLPEEGLPQAPLQLSSARSCPHSCWWLGRPLPGHRGVCQEWLSTQSTDQVWRLASGSGRPGFRVPLPAPSPYKSTTNFPGRAEKMEDHHQLWPLVPGAS